MLSVICYKYYNPKKKSPDDEKKIPPETGVGVDVLLANTTTLSDWTLNISTLDDCIKNKFELTFTEAVIDPVEIWYKFNPTIDKNNNKAYSLNVLRSEEMLR